MYEPFKFDELIKRQDWLENFNLDLDRSDPMTKVFTEAYFSGGKDSMAPIVKAFENLKTMLEVCTAEQGSKFSAFKFVKNLKFKELEDGLRQAFGFRNIEIFCNNDNYNPAKGTFKSEELNCYTYPTWRYPIDGLVTDKGFFDSTHSINTSVTFTLGLLNSLTPAECTAILLHEIGHNLDPALVDINYTVTNVLSKYLTERESKITPKEKTVVKKLNDGEMVFIAWIIMVIGVVIIAPIVSFIGTLLRLITFDKDKAISDIKTKIRHDGRFSRITNQEAFADNFARMYGFGGPLVSASNKIEKFFEKKRNSRFKKEKERQQAIARIVQYSIADVHKTDIHRINSLIREYEVDLKDPVIPDEVKKSIRADLEEVKQVLNSYLKDRSEFENRVNQVILDELKSADIKFDQAQEKKAKQAKIDSELKTALEATNISDDILGTIIEAVGEPENFKMSERLMASLPFRLEILRRNGVKPPASLASKLHRLGWLSKPEAKLPYDKNIYYCDPPSSNISYDMWDVIDITDLYLEQAEAADINSVLISAGKIYDEKDNIDHLLMKSNCLGTGIKLVDDASLGCFIQIMTADLPDPNVFGNGIKVVQIVTDHEWGSDSYRFITSKTIPEHAEAYRTYADLLRKYNENPPTPAELNFSECESFKDLWTFTSDLIDTGRVIKIGERIIDLAKIKATDWRNRKQAWLCRKDVSDKYSYHIANIGGYTTKCQDENTICQLCITAGLTGPLGDSISDCGSVWVDPDNSCDWDCY